MAKWGSCDFSELEKFAKDLEKLAEVDVEELCIACSKELAARLLKLVVPRTPVGDYPKDSGKKGGTLRRGWISKTQDEAAQGKGSPSREQIQAYADSVNITKSGSDYIITILNPVEYASYVEFGHRKVNGGYTDPRYMLTKSEEELKNISPKVLEKMVLKKLKEVCNG